MLDTKLNRTDFLLDEERLEYEKSENYAQSTQYKFVYTLFYVDKKVAI